MYLLTFFLPIYLSAGLSVFNYVCLFRSQLINQSVKFLGSFCYHISIEMQCLLRSELNPLLPGGPFLYPLKTSANLRFFYVFRGYKKEAPGSDGWLTVRKMDSQSELNDYGTPYL